MRQPITTSSSSTQPAAPAAATPRETGSDNESRTRRREKRRGSRKRSDGRRTTGASRIASCARAAARGRASSLDSCLSGTAHAPSAGTRTLFKEAVTRPFSSCLVRRAGRGGNGEPVGLLRCAVAAMCCRCTLFPMPQACARNWGCVPSFTHALPPPMSLPSVSACRLGCKSQETSCLASPPCPVPSRGDPPTSCLHSKLKGKAKPFATRLVAVSTPWPSLPLRHRPCFPSWAAGQPTPPRYPPEEVAWEQQTSPSGPRLRGAFSWEPSSSGSRRPPS